MGRGTRSPYSRCRIAAGIVPALCIAGCSAGAFNLGMVAGLAYDSEQGTPSTAGVLDPSRRVREQDCSKPIEDPSANLKCR